MESELKQSFHAAPDGQANATPGTLAQAFADSVARFSDREAIKPQDGEAITYAMLEQRVLTALAVLRHMGIEQGDRIAICLPNRPEWADLTLAAALAGVCVVPINVRYRPEELHHALLGSGVRVLFSQTQFLSNPLLERLQAIAGGALAGPAHPIDSLPMLKHIVLIDGKADQGVLSYNVLSDQAAPVTASVASLAAERSGAEPMWLFWTSGTTSRPKAALLPQSTVEIISEWTTLAGYGPDDRVLTSRPLFYIAGHFWSLLGPLLKGACSVIGSHFTAQEMVQLCKSERITILSGNPVMFKRLIQDSAFDPEAFAHVRLGYFGGSALPPDEMKRIQAAIGFNAMLQTYGMTELGGFIMSTLPGDSLDVACESCGYPFTRIDLKIVSPESGLEVPDGEVGMLLTRGQKLIGYVNQTDEERARLYDEEGWYRTGDLMRRLANGRYQLVGRFKDLIKVAGENVSAGEIEDTLMQNEAVSLAAVVARPDSDRGEVPVAFVELHTQGALDMAALRAWSRARMAPFKVPTEFYEVQSRDWPMTSTGKIAKHELAARLLSGANGLGGS